jgi:hypothetical protein
LILDKGFQIIKHSEIFRTGGTQIFFYPLKIDFAFAALSFRIQEEPEKIGDINSLVFHHVTFHFGDNVLLGRDGYHTRR